MRALLLSVFVVILAACVTTPETGRKAFIVTSEGEEAQLGAQAYRETLAKERLSTNARWTQVVQRVGSRIAQAANKPGFQWEFKLIESKQVNAFCLPGGKVAVYTGILPVAQNEAALAAVLGHEVAHATARHGGQRITTSLGTQLGLVGLGAIMGGGKGSQDKQLLLAALGVGAQVGVVLPFSRGNESEADEIGMIYMARAGYDPREAPKLWERMARLGGGGPELLSEHPASQKRQQALQAQIPRVLPTYEASPKYGVGETL